MIFLFTYHKVRESDSAGGNDFYTVSPDQLARHIAMLNAKGFQNLKIDELIRNPIQSGNKYILTFDDGTYDHYEIVFPLLQKNNCQGVFFIPTSKLNKPGYITNAQVRKLADAGHAVGFHSHEHQRLDLSPQEEIRRQITLSQQILYDITGVKPLIFSPPGGYLNARIREASLELGVQAIRTMRWGYNKKIDLIALETIPINRFTNDKKFLNILESHNSRFLYMGKEALKRLIPLRGYELLRNLLFKFKNSE
ncbi:MAG: polysaccharide deacetylase family protein [Pedosphaera sp.]|nr:polysaccharide deacetylase family protein [Pedosphaera sp.]